MSTYYGDAPIEDLLYYLEYCPSGKIFWRRNNGSRARAGSEAGYFSKRDKRHQTRFMRKLHKTSRIVWALHNHRWPSGVIDHINGDSSDNRIENLREISKEENMRNQKMSTRNRTGIMGVHKYKRGWQGQIQYKCKTYRSEFLNDFFEACCWRKSKEVSFGFHKNHGRLHINESYKDHTNLSDQVKEFHKVSGVDLMDMEDTPVNRSLSLSLVTEELVELFSDGLRCPTHLVAPLREAFTGLVDYSLTSEWDKAMVADAIGDSLYVLTRLGLSIGLDMKAVMNEVHGSNMSKYTVDKTIAEDSANNYGKSGRAVTIDEVKDGDKTIYVVKDSNTGKVLKASSFKEPNFNRIIGDE